MASKSEAKRLAVTGKQTREVTPDVTLRVQMPEVRATWFAQCNCDGDTYSTESSYGPSCKSCGSPWIRVPHVVEDRIRADERRKFRSMSENVQGEQK